MSDYDISRFTGEFDLVGMTEAEKSAFLKLDQTTPQTIENGVPLMTTPVDEYGSGDQLVNLDYVRGGSWLLPPIITWYDPTDGLPVDPAVGDRYGADATANGWTIDYIYEWDGSVWVESEPEDGWLLWDLFGMMFYFFFSGGWAEVGYDSFWSLWYAQTGLTGDKSGNFNLDVGTGTITATSYVGLPAETDPLSLHLDQSGTPQTITATDVAITATDEIYYGDVTDSTKIKKDTVQGILDLVPASVDNFSYETLLNSITVVIPDNQQMIVCEEFDSQATSELQVEGSLFVEV